MSQAPSYAFKRSIDLRADGNDKGVLNHLLYTQPLRKTVKAVYTVLTSASSEYSISIVGPYGSGKSTTALFLRKYLEGNLTAKQRKDIVTHGLKLLPPSKNYTDIRVLVGRNQSIQSALRTLLGLSPKEDAVEYLKTKLHEGSTRLAILIDEMGKFLEYAAEFPQEGDVYVLQRLAELSHRLNGQLLLITIRHQSMAAYVQRISTEHLTEWKKIQGRFVDIVHSNTVDDTVEIVYQYLPYLGLRRTSASESILKLLGANPLVSEQTVTEHLQYVYSLNPIVLLLLISFFKRHVQNERSVFSFLASYESHSIRQFSSDHDQDEIYGPEHLFKYIESNLQHAVLESEYGNAWTKINSSLLLAKSSVPSSEKYSDSSVSLTIISIGLISLYGDIIGIKPNKEAIEAILAGTLKSRVNEVDEVENVLSALEKHQVLIYRPAERTFHLWHGSSVDIREAITQTIQQNFADVDYANQLNKHFSSIPIIPKKYLIETGVYRFIEWQYNSPASINDEGELNTRLIRCFIGSKGQIQGLRRRYKPENTPPFLATLSLALSDGDLSDIQQYLAIQFLLTQDEQVKRDTVAKTELSKMLQHHEQKIRATLNWNSRVSLENTKYQYFNEDSWTQLKKAQSINRLISDALASVYPFTPPLHNELINTDYPTGSAMVGLKRLYIHLLEDHDKVDMGIVGRGPEYSIYLNVLRETGIHQQEKRKWRLGRPNSKNENLANIWNHIKDTIIFRSKAGEKVSLAVLEGDLKKRPFGLKAGLAKLILFSRVINMLPNLSVYEENSFTPILLRDTVERMMKLPHLFAIRYVSTSDVHLSLFTDIKDAINVETSDGGATLLEIVTPLVQFANRLPYFTKHTKSITDRTSKFIDSILHAASPEELIFEGLPKAFGIQTIKYASVKDPEVTEEYVKSYVDAVKACHNEANSAYGHILDNCAKQFAKLWGFKSHELSIIRAESKQFMPKSIQVYLVEDRLIALYNRIWDEIEDVELWFVSLVSLLANKPVNRWLDHDFQVFSSELQLRILQITEIKKYTMDENEDETNNISNDVIRQMIMGLLTRYKYTDHQAKKLLGDLIHKYTEKD